MRAPHSPGTPSQASAIKAAPGRRPAIRQGKHSKTARRRSFSRAASFAPRRLSRGSGSSFPAVSGSPRQAAADKAAASRRTPGRLRRGAGGASTRAGPATREYRRPRKHFSPRPAPLGAGITPRITSRTTCGLSHFGNARSRPTPTPYANRPAKTGECPRGRVE